MYDRKVRQRVYHAGDKVWVRDFRAAAGGKPKLGLRHKGPWVEEGHGSKDGRGAIYRGGRGVRRILWEWGSPAERRAPQAAPGTSPEPNRRLVATF